MKKYILLLIVPFLFACGGDEKKKPKKNDVSQKYRDAVCPCLEASKSDGGSMEEWEEKCFPVFKHLGLEVVMKESEKCNLDLMIGNSDNDNAPFPIKTHDDFKIYIGAAFLEMELMDGGLEELDMLIE